MATNRNKMIRELEAKFQTVTLPDGRNLSEEELFAAYISILSDLNIQMQTQLEALRKVVLNELMRVQEEIQKKAAEDLIAGRITLDQMPLKRTETAEGVSLENVPLEIMKVASFMAWLNDKVRK